MKSFGRFVALVIGCVCALPISARAQVSPVTGQNAPITVCFAEGTDAGYAERVNNLVEVNNQIFMTADYYLAQRWSGAQGTPRTLTWSFAPDGINIGSGVGEPSSPNSLFATMDAGFAAQGGRATWINRFQQIFDRWHQISGVTFVRVTSGGNDWDDGAGWGTGGAAGARGDIRVAMHPIDGSSGILAYCAYPSSGDMVLDANDIGNYASSTNQHRFLRDVVAHEMGHGLGIQHVCSNNSNQLMEPFINTAFDGPQQDDIRAMHRHYGDPLEANDSAVTATTLGTLNPSATLSIGTLPNPVTGTNDANAALCSIDAAGKTDWYVFTAAASMNVTFTATPVGSTYDSTAQASNGSCPTGTTVNAAAVADLSVDVFGSNGTTLVASSNTSGAGVAESLSSVSLSAGPYYVRVSASNSPTQSQLYRFSVASTCATAPFTEHPASQALQDRAPLTLHGAATGAIGYRWRKNGVDLEDDARISGSGTSTLQISSTVLADAGTYTLAAINGCGTGVSNPAVVSISCYPNCDLSTTPPVLNVSDFTCFLFMFADANPYANCDGSATTPTINILDFSCFLQKFAAGCP